MLKTFGGDLTKFKVRKIYPSRLRQECISRIEPGDENNQDISSLVGELDIRLLEDYPQNHPFAYSFSGGLNRGNGGLVEFVEMFKTPIKMLHPLLTATQDRQYAGTKSIGRIPFDGIIMAHSNESEWQQFKNNKTNEAFLDRVYIVKVPYCTRVYEEVQIYKKLLRHSTLHDAPCAPGTLEFLAQFCVMSRIKEPENSSLWSKMRVYNGENIKNDDPRAKPLQEYKDAAGVNEGMDGLSTRFAFKILSKTFNFDNHEIAANPIHLMYVLKTNIAQEEFPEDKETSLLDSLDGVLSEKYKEFLEKDITASFLESFTDLCQNVFETYFYYADAWVADTDYRDPDTGTMFDRAALNAELEKIEKPAGIASPKDFRNDVTMFVVRYKANHEGRLPRWDEFEKMRQVVEKKVVASTDEILPVISFAPKRSEDDKRKHDQFVAKMKERGYTERQTRYLCEWFMRTRKSS
jgi:serine protein kinase